MTLVRSLRLPDPQCPHLYNGCRLWPDPVDAKARKAGLIAFPSRLEVLQQQVFPETGWEARSWTAQTSRPYASGASLTSGAGRRPGSPGGEDQAFLGVGHSLRV